ncbi:MAG: cytochrome c-type biogenesis protein [Gammaproteobacteria bacterium]
MKYFSGRLALLICLLAVLPLAHAVKIEFHDFKDRKQEQLYLQLIADLRCVKCQNQNLAESNAELAKDMRDKTYAMIIDGGSRADVVKYMTDRYGDFVLYKPPFQFNTLLLWIGPPVFLFLSLYLLFRLIRKQKPVTTESLSEQDRESVRELLKPASRK